MSEQVFSHKPVLLDECIEALAIRPEGVYLDGTLGRAGHSREIVRRLTTGRLICVDRDQAALDAAEERLAPWRERVTLVHSNFCALDAILDVDTRYATDWSAIKQSIKGDLSNYLYKKTKRSPMILPVIMEV